MATKGANKLNNGLNLEMINNKVQLINQNQIIMKCCNKELIASVILNIISFKFYPVEKEIIQQVAVKQTRISVIFNYNRFSDHQPNNKNAD